ncbi:MAG TPA: capsule assembly Wzi family protein [Acidobacteriaceae bacterium]|jgi:hypothetical protein
MLLRRPPLAFIAFAVLLIALTAPVGLHAQDGSASAGMTAAPAPVVAHAPLEAALEAPDGPPLSSRTASPASAFPIAAPASPAASASSPFSQYISDTDSEEHPNGLGSTYIPVDSPIYTMALRLYALGYLDRAFIGMRPWTRRSLLHMLQATSENVMNDGNDEAIGILAKLNAELEDEDPGVGMQRGTIFGLESAYTRVMGVSGQTLRDSFHLGQTIVNDYGRPYQTGFNNVTGFSSVNEWGRFSLYIRGEYQHAPSANGYSLALASTLSCNDLICPFAPPNQPQATIPYGPIAAQNPFRLQEAALSFHLLGHEISGGKTDAWIGPGYGSGMAWSNNAENIYSFRINRVEPLHIPLVSRLLGPLRYDFFVGSLKGHTDPNEPWVHQETFSFRPTRDFEFAFQRTVIWGGKGHEPVTLHTFLRSFFSISDTTGLEKFGPTDPGARFTAFNFSWRLPYIRKYAMLYTDSETHDDVTPISAPRRASFRPGLDITQLPFLPKLELRMEGATTDPPTTRSMGGLFNYDEGIQLQGYTNKGFIMGDWIGREGKGGQAWLTYHLSGNEWIQLEYMHKKILTDFIPQGTTQNHLKVDLEKRLRKDIELNAWVQWEGWKAPVYKSGLQNDFVVAGQVTFYPKLHNSASH